MSRGLGDVYKRQIFNPSTRIYGGSGGGGFGGGFSQTGVYAGGQHWIYVFKNAKYEEGLANRMPTYDEVIICTRT